MSRAWLIFTLAVFAAGALDLPGLVSAVATEEAGHGCAQSCFPGETSTEPCSSECPACPCAPHGSPTLLPRDSARLVDLAPAPAPGPELADPLSEAHPRSVFHPPKAR